MTRDPGPKSASARVDHPWGIKPAWFSARQVPVGHRLASLLGLAMLSGWVLMWVNAYLTDRLEKGDDLWVPQLDFLAGDFVVHIARTARIWADGGNPYEPRVTWLAFPYPPLIPRFFTWTSLTGIREAIAIWLVGIAALMTLGTSRTWRTRRELGLPNLPPSLMLAVVLLSTPVIFAMERGQCDILVLPLLAGGVSALRGQSRRLDLLAGLLFVVAAYVKYYPGLVIIGLLALRRWYAVGGFLAAGIVIGLLDLRWLIGSFENMKIGIAMFGGAGKTTIHPCEHSLAACWGPFWSYWDLPMLARLPGRLMAPLVILPMVAFVCHRVGRQRWELSKPLLWPLMLWVVSAATFIPPMANDYNLLFLPLAALAVWSHRDPPAVHLLMAYLLLWWQPFDLGIDGAVILLFKLGGLCAVGLSLCRLASEQPHPFAVPNRPEERWKSPGLEVATGV